MATMKEIFAAIEDARENYDDMFWQLAPTVSEECPDDEELLESFYDLFR